LNKIKKQAGDKDGFLVESLALRHPASANHRFLFDQGKRIAKF
jgi:hypothetical protein